MVAAIYSLLTWRSQLTLRFLQTAVWFTGQIAATVQALFVADYACDSRSGTVADIYSSSACASIHTVCLKRDV